ncbi:EamA family transporter RarD [Parapusillimonas granuli]|uniref:EamA family transporter RarD n=1 Tax=Parapusillimonas granuli TaxID=380911 RepID=A0A853G3W2_9BURK|nr:EamA family transporter RarD [Parapusillimonas granuli]MBB5216783.1 chloramphenicol-sensitive protein RarD [Parapusillimonas granuli]MEB2400112.1 EamA family transporter RarD [Alcaligenaceae bacterium]NYT51573.1 EamA family transporter RarD [Parapusillimonas granuli]
MTRGVVLSVLSSVLFAVLYYYTTLLHPLDGAEIFAWRILLCLPAVAVLLARSRGWKEVAQVFGRLRREWRLWLLLPLSSALIGAQLWLFVWAPLHQRALDVSMGYFLLPLVMVLVGRVLYKEKLNRLQTAAVAIAVLGVAHEFLRTGAFSWVTALVMFGYPPYFILRRKLRTGSLSTLWFDMMLMVPAAFFILGGQEVGVVEQFQLRPALLFLVPVLGAISSAALIAYLSASRYLPLGLFGLLGYVEPVLLFWVAFLFLSEEVPVAAWFTYVPIWVAVVLVAADGARALAARR